ncbi:MAG: HetZ-related protein [Moorea sp. SIO2B7]|nr:HetZ-related protein [Moorena sp. SIO2B7]
MQVTIMNSQYQSSHDDFIYPERIKINEPKSLQQVLQEELKAQVKTGSASVINVATRIAHEVERICDKSDRIQSSGQIQSWELSLARHRLNKCLTYYQLGSKQGRIELHSNLSVMVYRHIALSQAKLGFAGRYNLIEDFLQEFYTESLRAFRRENEVAPHYQPRTKLELAEYMAFTEHYGKRRITLPNGYSQQLIILRAQTFARRQPSDTVVDIEQAAELSKAEDTQSLNNSPVMNQVRVQMVAETSDPSDSLLRDRLISTLFQYLESNGHSDCANYLALKLQDFSTTEIDDLLNLTPRERDYLQQRFKYHVDKFARSSHWKLVHQWLEADIDQKLGMTSKQWQKFIAQLSPQQQQMLQLKREKQSPQGIAQTLNLTPKKVQKGWMEILALAWKIRNSNDN